MSIGDRTPKSRRIGHAFLDRVLQRDTAEREQSTAIHREHNRSVLRFQTTRVKTQCRLCMYEVRINDHAPGCRRGTSSCEASPTAITVRLVYFENVWS